MILPIVIRASSFLLKFSNIPGMRIQPTATVRPRMGQERRAREPAASAESSPDPGGRGLFRCKFPCRILPPDDKTLC